ncbi:hydantoinase B/oxoprolinase family protein [Mesorhizobium sp. M4A.F.Ca.ET.022.05.2.1]|uniref:hydantoinase B/oxoprolinase family protein n=1 Tax=Mesorhizobium sp. M4A.F.Ca.ET.022.05.2.1 TaxID=2496653 RepID=UPI001AEC7AFB|nr:hydantoinase B/oxoprolinase family protein [Mesorhizobium sp. M4A.F.Ca.ET.022.05.2.1]
MNPITVEIVRNGLISAAEEMNAMLIRSAFTPIIYEMKDCAVAILDRDHKVLGQSSGLPIFLGNLEICSEYTERKFGKRVWREGDIWALNDTYVVGTHLNDVSVYAPIFFKGELFGFAVSRAHWLDIGGKDPGQSFDSTEIFQEGLRLPPTRVVIEGQINPDVVDIIEANTRLPKGVIGDLKAQIAAANVGSRRIVELLEKFGVDVVEKAKGIVFDQTESFERAAIEAIPDGKYSAEGYVDDDGLGNGPLYVKMTVAVKGSDIEIDVTEASDQTLGPINSGKSQTVSACRVGFKYLFASDKPVNGGSFRSLSVKVRDGSFLACTSPAAANWYFSSLGLQIDLLARALADAIPGVVTAADYGDSNPVIMSGTDPRTEGIFIDFECHVGGWGAFRGQDGVSALINKVNGGLKDIPIEVCETRYPLRIREYSLRSDSGGAGEWRGGCGINKTYEMLSDQCAAGFWWERSVTPAWGLFGGKDGQPPSVTVKSSLSGEIKRLKANGIKLKSGDLITCRSGGGGGYGHPSLRDRKAIEEDIADGFITVEGAMQDYGYKPNP